MILKRLTANEPDGLDEVSGLLHDSYGDQDLVTFDEHRALLEFPVAQEIDTWMDVPPGSPRTRGRKRRYLPFSSLQVPFMQVNVTVRSVRAFQLGPENLDDPWVLDDIEYAPAEHRVVFTPVIGPVLSVEVAQLSVDTDVTTHAAVTVRRRVWPFVGHSDAPEGDMRFRWPMTDAS